jgi:hypothetical protein
MAPPTDPPNPAGATASAFVNARLSVDEAERLAATFRPSWEPDGARLWGPEATTDPGGHAATDLHGADVHAEVRALNGSHAPAPSTVLDEPRSSVILDPSITVDASGAPAQGPTAAGAQPVPQSQTPTRRARVPATAQPRAGFPVSAPRARVVSLDLSDVEYAKRSKKGILIIVGAAAALLVGVGVWMASSGGEKEAAPLAPSTQKTTPAATETPRATPRTPPAQTTIAQPAAIPPPPQAPVPPPAAQPVAAAATIPPPAPPTPPVAPPPPPPPPRLVVPAAPRPPTWTPPPAPRPVARPKAGGTTIVRDVPF